MQARERCFFLFLFACSFCFLFLFFVLFCFFFLSLFYAMLNSSYPFKFNAHIDAKRVKVLLLVWAFRSVGLTKLVVY